MATLFSRRRASGWHLQTSTRRRLLRHAVINSVIQCADSNVNTRLFIQMLPSCPLQITMKLIVAASFVALILRNHKVASSERKTIAIRSNISRSDRSLALWKLQEDFSFEISFSFLSFISRTIFLSLLSFSAPKFLHRRRHREASFILPSSPAIRSNFLEGNDICVDFDWGS